MAKHKSPSVLKREKLATDKRLKKNYARLRKAGFSTYDAGSMRYGSRDKIRTAIKTKTRPAISPTHQKSGGGSGVRYKHLDTFQKAYPISAAHKGRIKQADYEIVNMDSERKYLSNYTYKMTYITVDAQGIETRKFITYGSSEIMTKGELKQWAWDTLNEPGNVSEYQAKPLKRSIEFLSAHYSSDNFIQFLAKTNEEQAAILNSKARR